MSTWLINGSTPESLGLSVVGGVLQSGSASSVSLRAERDFDAAELEEYGDDVTITLDGNPFFRGRIRQIAKSGSASIEGHDYAVEDAWADMERTTYQETWQSASGATLIPRVFLGVAPNGDARTLGEQIEAAIDFAVTSGIAIQKGSIPAGLQLWPEEVDGISIAEVIRTSLRFHPDWIPWIDHSTTPPTFNVTPAADAATLTIPAAECSDLTVTEIEDRLPDVVRIVYVTASQIESEGEAQISRTIAVDKFPASGADSGTGVLSVSVDLQGVKASIQKQQVETRDLPADQAELKIWLKEKFPALEDVPEAAFDVTAPTRTVIPDVAENDLPPPINPNAVRLRGTTTTDLPRELVRGVIHEWIRRKVGTVRVDFDIRPSETATVEQADLIARIPKAVSVTATNAKTKTYRGLASWEDAENIPAGVAEAYYDTIRSGARFEGSISTPDAALAGWHGRKLRLTDGVTAWATMDAPIHAIRWDAHTMAASVSFGPTPTYAFQDFMEYLKLLRRRPVTWISAAERSGAEIGSATSASANGDIVGPFDAPRDVPEFDSADPIPHAFYMRETSGGDVILHPGKVWVQSVKLVSPSGSASVTPTLNSLLVPGIAIYSNESMITPTVNSTPHTAPVVVGDADNQGSSLYCRVQNNAATYVWLASPPAAPSPADDPGAARHYLIGALGESGGITQHRRSDIFHHIYEPSIPDED